MLQTDIDPFLNCEILQSFLALLTNDYVLDQRASNLHMASDHTCYCESPWTMNCIVSLFIFTHDLSLYSLDGLLQHKESTVVKKNDT